MISVKSKIAAGIATLSATVLIVGSFLPPSQTARLQIRQVCIPVLQAKMCIEPHPSNPYYYTNYGGTNIIAFENQQSAMTAISGPAVEVYWDAQPNPVVLQQSKDASNFEDIRVVLVGVTNYFAPIGDGGFFRLKLL